MSTKMDEEKDPFVQKWSNLFLLLLWEICQSKEVLKPGRRPNLKNKEDDAKVYGG